MKKLFIPVNDLTPINFDFTKLAAFKIVGLTSTIQFKHHIKEVERLLKKDHEVIIMPTVLGCRVQKRTVDCTLIITTGVFHAIKIALVTGKPVFILGPDGLKRLDDKLVIDYQKKQSIRISKVVDAKIIGVLVSTKPGQANELLAKKIVSQLRAKGKEAYLFVANEFNPLQLNDFPVDAWINTACPRLVEDEFDKPMVNWDEVKDHF